MRTTTTLAAALALGLSVIGGTTAVAGGPEQEKFHEQFSETDEFLSEICGFTVAVDGDISGTARFWPDGSIHVNERGAVVFSNPDSGKTLTNWWRRNFKGHGNESINDDGHLVINFDDTYTGIPERWIDDDGNTLIMDRGFARFVGELVIDLNDPDNPFDDEIVHVHEDVITHGPHPILEGGLDPSLACDLLS